MASIQVYQYCVINTNDRTIAVGSLSQARSVTLGDGEVIDRIFKVAPETATKVWDKTVDAALGGFDLLWLETDLDVLAQLTTDAGGDNEYFVVELKGSGTAGRPGLALVLGSDVAHQFDGTVDSFDGTADTIDEIFVYNSDDTDTATIRLVVAT